jgi:hypothetical protein
MHWRRRRILTTLSSTLGTCGRRLSSRAAFNRALSTPSSRRIALTLSGSRLQGTCQTAPYAILTQSRIPGSVNGTSLLRLYGALGPAISSSRPIQELYKLALLYADFLHRSLHPHTTIFPTQAPAIYALAPPPPGVRELSLTAHPRRSDLHPQALLLGSVRHLAFRKRSPLCIHCSRPLQQHGLQAHPYQQRRSRASRLRLQQPNHQHLAELLYAP